ncbi:MAG: PAS domain S-box protein [Nitrospirota bacterium]
MTGTKKSGKEGRAKGAGKKTAAGPRPVKSANAGSGKAAAAQKESEEKYRLLIEATNTGYVIIDEQGMVLDANEEYVKMSGHDSLEEIIGRVVTEWTAAYDLERNAAEVRKCMECGSVRHLVIDYVGPQGRATPVEINATVLRGAGSPRIFTVCRDITERRRAEEALRESENTFRGIIDTFNEAVYIQDENGTFIDVNKGAEQMYGYTRNEFIGMSPATVSAEGRNDLGRVAEQFRLAFDGEHQSFEFWGVAKNGRVFPKEVHLYPNRYFGRKTVVAIAQDITERKRAEEALRRSEARYRMLYEGTPVMMHSIDAEGKLISVSDQWLKTLGYSRDEVLGRRSTEFLDEQSRTYARTEVLPDFMRTGICADVPYTFVKKNGECISTLLSAIAERDEAGKVARSLAVIIDITEGKRAEEKLRESETRFRRLAEQSPIAILIIDRTGRIEYTNKKHTEIVGYTVKEIPTVEAWWALAYRDAEIRQRIMTAWEGISRRILSGEDVEPIERTIVCKDGSNKDVEMRFSLAGEKILVVFIDITERKRVEDALRASEGRFRAITMTASDAILLMDDKGKIIYWNPAAERIFGHSADEAVGRDLHLFLAPQRMYENHQKGFALFAKTGQGPVVNRSVEMMAKRKEGTEFPIEVSTSAMNVNGKWHALGIVRDITERKLAEASLRQSEERFRDLAESLPLTVFEMDLQGRFTYVNRVALEKFGYSQQEFDAGLIMTQMIAPGDRDRVREVMARRLAGNADGYNEYQGLRKDGTTFPITVASIPILRDGRPVGFRGIAMDLSERKQLEEERLKSQKLESIGTLAGGIAHDFNNLLQGIFGYISMAKLTIDQRAKSLAMLEQAEKALHQSVNLTSQLLTFSKGGKPVKKVTDLRPVIENAVKFALSGSQVSYDLSFGHDLSAVDADEGQLGQVVQNIALNAEQSMPLGGRIEIAVRNVPPSQAAGLPLTAPDGLVEIVVRDQGMGIPSEHLPRIFDPYFTTKEKGSGLGLATSYSIVKNHDGMIDVASVLGKGSTLTVYLPATRAALESAAATVSARCAPGRKCRVLVMDDEPIVRVVAGELLRELGHEAEFAEHGDSAIEKYRRAKDAGRPFDVVILDLTIRGGMGGEEAFRKLKEIDPGVKAVVSSGYSDDEVVATYRQYGFRDFLKKPYDMRELARVLSEVIA